MGLSAAKQREDYMSRRQQQIEHEKEVRLRIEERRIRGQREQEAEDRAKAELRNANQQARPRRPTSLLATVKHIAKASATEKAGMGLPDPDFSRNPPMSVEKSTGLDPHVPDKRPAWGIFMDLEGLKDVNAALERDKMLCTEDDILEGFGTDNAWSWILWDGDHGMPVNTKVRVNPKAYVVEYADAEPQGLLALMSSQPAQEESFERTDSLAMIAVQAARQSMRQRSTSQIALTSPSQGSPPARPSNVAPATSPGSPPYYAHVMSHAKLTQFDHHVCPLPEPHLPPHKSLGDLFVDVLKGSEAQWLSVTMHVAPQFTQPLQDIEDDVHSRATATSVKITHVFGAFAEIFGLDNAEDIVGKPLTTFVRIPTTTDEMLAKPDAELTSRELLRKGFRVDEDYFPYSWVIADRPRMTAQQTMKYNMTTEIEVIGRRRRLDQESSRPNSRANSRAPSREGGQRSSAGQSQQRQPDPQPIYEISYYLAGMQVLPPPKFAQYKRKTQDKYSLKIFVKTDKEGLINLSPVQPPDQLMKFTEITQSE